MAERKRDYEVGFGKPPKTTRFKPGQSGNPRGRSKGSKNFKTQLIEELTMKVRVVENGQALVMTKLEAAIKTLMNKVLAGDMRATRMLFELVGKHDTENDENIGHDVLPLSEEDEEAYSLLKERIKADPLLKQQVEDDQ
jgi:hypothetical protein